MRQLRRWLAILIVVAAPAVVVAQGTGGAGEQVRDPGHGTVAVDETAGSALPRSAGVERYSRAQRTILVMLVTLLTLALLLGIATIVHELRDHGGRRRGGRNF